MPTKYLPRMRGLFTYKSEISEVPEGSFDILDNFVIDKEGILQPRRGFKTIELSTGITDDIVNKQFEYNNTQLLKYPSGLYRRDDTTLTKYTGDFDVPTGAVRNASLLANRNFYITTDDGILKLDAIDGTFRKAGAPTPVPPVVELITGTILRPGNSFRYRLQWGYNDANGNLVLGPVSDSVEIPNSGTENHNVRLTVDIPDEVQDNTWFLQAYRSFQAIVPDEELQLAIEKAPTAAELIARKMILTDDRTMATLGALIDVAPSQGPGLISNNARPPKCVDMTLFNNHAIYANTTGPQKLIFTLLATGTTSGDVQENTVITINGQDYTGKLATSEIVTLTSVDASNIAWEDVTLTIPLTNGSETIYEFSANAKPVTSGNVEINLQEAGIKQIERLRLISQTKADYTGKTITISNRANATGLVIPSVVFELLDNTAATGDNVGIDISGVTFGEVDTVSDLAAVIRVGINNEEGLTAEQNAQDVNITQDTAGIVSTITTDIDVANSTVTRTTQGLDDVDEINNLIVTALTLNLRLAITEPTSTTIQIVQLDPGSVTTPTTTGAATILTIVQDTAGAEVEDVTNRIFEVIGASAGTPSLSPGTDAELTARSLVRIINGYNAQIQNGITAIYSTSAKLVGTMILEQKIISDTAFTVQADPSKNSTNTTVGEASFDPSISDAFSSTSVTRPNGILISKPDQPEAVPEIQFLTAGSANSPIRRVLPIRDSCFLFKDDGIFQMTGRSLSTFRIEELDLTARIIAPESVVALNNQIWALTDQGIVSVTESAVQIRSREIEDSINRLFNTPDTLRDNAFSIAYESDRKLVYFAPQISNADIAQEAYVFNTITNTWTRWDLSAKCGIVFEDKLNLSAAVTDDIREENKNFSFRDYADGGELINITMLNVLTNSATFIVPDVSIWEINGLIDIDGLLGFNYITAIDTATRQITIQGTIPANTATVRVYRPIPVKARWNPIDVGDISYLKQFSQMLFSFRRPFVLGLDLAVVTDNSRAVQNQTIQGEAGFGLWGAFPWGALPWGGGEKSYKNYRALIPRNKSYGIMVQPQISQAVGFSNFELVALTIDYRIVSERSAR